MAAKKTVKGKRAQEAPAPTKQTNWQAVLDDLGAESNDPRLFFLKGGRNRLRLIPEDPQDPKSFFTTVTRTYQGQSRVKFLIRALVMSNDEDATPSIRAIPIGKTAMKAILNLLAEGYDLLDPKTGHGVTIVRSGSALDTSYTVVSSPKPVPVPRKHTKLEDSMASIAEDVAAGDLDRDEQGDNNRPKKGRGKGKKEGSLRRRLEGDNDEQGDW